MLRSRPRRAGFTLLELLTVLLVIGVLAGVVVLTHTGGSETRTLQAHAERFTLATELARQKAILANELWGIRVRGSSYDFLRRADDGAWNVIAESPFGYRDLGGEYEVRHRHLGSSPMRGRKSSSDALPDIVIYPSGGISPFELSLTSRINQTTRYVIGDGIQRVVISDMPYEPIELVRES